MAEAIPADARSAGLSAAPTAGERAPRAVRAQRTGSTAFGFPRHSFGHRSVYAVISPRAGGLSIGVNLNPDRACNFDCVYCEVNRSLPVTGRAVDVGALTAELREMLAWARDGRFAQRPEYRGVPVELLRLRDVALSGDGEPTLCPCFREVVEAVVHLRAVAGTPFFKLVLITNATGLDRPEVRAGLACFTARDEVWAKLDVGTQAGVERINRGMVPIEQVLVNIRDLARERPVVIQSLFCKHLGLVPSWDEISAFIARLKELKAAGARIALVQVYSAHRPTVHPECEHLALPALSAIAKRVRAETGLRVEVY
jgi:wyosine [tRNA(Phe)-imidazoG37] synthetase (radical SAM superfamily)